MRACTHEVTDPYCGEVDCLGFGRELYRKGWRFSDGRFQEPSTGAAARQLVNEQAKDEGLWAEPLTAIEAYVQAALRQLHEAVETAPPAGTGDAESNRFFLLTFIGMRALDSVEVASARKALAALAGGKSD